MLRFFFMASVPHDERRNSILMTCHYPDLGSASDWLYRKRIFFQPISSTTKIWVVHVISMEFLRSLLRRRFARAQVATSRNVGCFLRLNFNFLFLFSIFSHEFFTPKFRFFLLNVRVCHCQRYKMRNVFHQYGREKYRPLGSCETTSSMWVNGANN